MKEAIKTFWYEYENAPRVSNPYENDEDTITEQALIKAIKKAKEEERKRLFPIIKDWYFEESENDYIEDDFKELWAMMNKDKLKTQKEKE